MVIEGVQDIMREKHKIHIVIADLKAGERGQATAEFAMVAIAFFLVLFGIMNFGKAIYAYNFVSNASREASRYASIHGSYSYAPAAASDITTLVKSKAIGLDTSKLTVTTTWSPDNKQGSKVSVQVQYSYPLSMPFMSSVTLPLTSTSQMVIWQ